MKAKPRAKVRSSEGLTAFWDTSGIVPLCCFQAQTTKSQQTARIYSRQVVWWGTIVEALSSIHRLAREGHLAPIARNQASRRLDYLRSRWNEIQPTEEVRQGAERLLAVHRLRTADAIQLAAALVWCSNRPRARMFVGADAGLLDAAEAEGFTIIRLL
jgi:predicted nucleic acid-binding protein